MTRRTRLLVYAALAIWTVIAIYPLALMIISSLKTTAEIYSNPFALPEVPHWENYVQAWARANFSVFFRNSLIVLALAVALTVATSTAAAYPIARYTFRGNRLLSLFFLIGLMLPIRLGIVQLFILLRDLGLLDTLTALVVVYVAMRIPFAVFVLTNFMKSVPREIEEAARIDGCSEPRLLIRIMVPMIRPALAITAIFTAIGVWNDFFFPFILIYTNSLKTIPAGLATFFGQYQVNWGLLYAGLTISAVPIIALYLLLSRHMVKGISLGAIK